MNRLLMLNPLNRLGQSFLLAHSFLVVTASSSFAQFTPPPPPLHNSQDGEVYQFEAPDNSLPRDRNSSSDTNTLFRVQVYGSSEQLLTLVRRVEPNAFVRPRENIIQAGLFSETENAQALVQSLSEQGIQADIVEVVQRQQNRSLSSNNAPREVISLFPATPTDVPTESVNPPDEPPAELIPIAVESSSPEPVSQKKEDIRGYYVVIPSRDEVISRTAAMVEAAGVTQNLIQTREAPRGDHVAVGPFSQREQANRWRSQLRGEGLDARVYFGR